MAGCEGDDGVAGLAASEALLRDMPRDLGR